MSRGVDILRSYMNILLSSKSSESFVVGPPELNIRQLIRLAKHTPPLAKLIGSTFVDVRLEWGHSGRQHTVIHAFTVHLLSTSFMLHLQLP